MSIGAGKDFSLVRTFENSALHERDLIHHPYKHTEVGHSDGTQTLSKEIAVSFDIEEWFQTYAARKWYPQETWDLQPKRVPSVIDRLLDTLDEHNTSATFFVLGWIAERQPELLIKIHERGHEIGYHGHSHMVLNEVDPDEFKRKMNDFFDLMHSLSLPPPIGFRAPSFSISKECSWIVGALSEFGFIYDSSIFPDFQYRFGLLDAPAEPFLICHKEHRIFELPLATFNLLGLRLPVAGGAYFRFYPGTLYRFMLDSIVSSSYSPVLYFHPWEFDERNVSHRMSLFQRIRQHYNTGHEAHKKLAEILSNYRGIALMHLFSSIESPDYIRYYI
ncbi:MAG: DUF3473 domain-containing protein [Candidatus Aegiribacteria sp.]|nr:DUF3473 domain-containing protein [Candidatus Aegiribacteria sp.]